MSFGAQPGSPARAGFACAGVEEPGSPARAGFACAGVEEPGSPARAGFACAGVEEPGSPARAGFACAGVEEPGSPARAGFACAGVEPGSPARRLCVRWGGGVARAYLQHPAAGCRVRARAASTRAVEARPLRSLRGESLCGFRRPGTSRRRESRQPSAVIARPSAVADDLGISTSLFVPRLLDHAASTTPRFQFAYCVILSGVARAFLLHPAAGCRATQSKNPSAVYEQKPAGSYLRYGK